MCDECKAATSPDVGDESDILPETYGKSKLPGESQSLVNSKGFRRALRMLLRQEHGNLGTEDPKAKRDQEAHSIKESLREHAHTGDQNLSRMTDDYSTATREPRAHQRSPFDMQHDAVLPVCWYDGRIRIHAPGNWAFTAVGAATRL